MNYERLIKREFKFLKSYGYKIKNYTRSFEIEIYFLKGNIEIGINYVGYNNEAVDCGIRVADKNENLLKNTIFDKDKTYELKMLIRNNIDSAERQIKIYAKFISDNMFEILNM